MNEGDLADTEQTIRDLNEAIAQVGWSMREMSEQIREFGYEVNPETDPQYLVAVFKW